MSRQTIEATQSNRSQSKVKFGVRMTVICDSKVNESSEVSIDAAKESRTSCLSESEDQQRNHKQQGEKRKTSTKVGSILMTWAGQQAKVTEPEQDISGQSRTLGELSGGAPNQRYRPPHKIQEKRGTFRKESQSPYGDVLDEKKRKDHPGRKKHALRKNLIQEGRHGKKGTGQMLWEE